MGGSRVGAGGEGGRNFSVVSSRDPNSTVYNRSKHLRNIPYAVTNIIIAIQHLTAECADPCNRGFTGFVRRIL